jgi:hypothetical protein
MNRRMRCSVCSTRFVSRIPFSLLSKCRTDLATSWLPIIESTAQSYRQKDKASSLILEPIRQLLQLSEWRGRHTGLMALSAVMSSVIEVGPARIP